jgi:hypothetical protein
MKFVMEDCGFGYIYSAEVDNKAQSGVITATPTGALPEGTNAATIGTITLTVAQMVDVDYSKSSLLTGSFGHWEASIKTIAPPDEYQRFLDVFEALGLAEFPAPTTDEEQWTLNKTYIDAWVLAQEFSEKYDLEIKEEW